MNDEQMEQVRQAARDIAGAYDFSEIEAREILSCTIRAEAGTRAIDVTPKGNKLSEWYRKRLASEHTGHLHLGHETPTPESPQQAAHSITYYYADGKPVVEIDGIDITEIVTGFSIIHNAQLAPEIALTLRVPPGSDLEVDSELEPEHTKPDPDALARIAERLQGRRSG